jgi:hypothetical protein
MSKRTPVGVGAAPGIGSASRGRAWTTRSAKWSTRSGVPTTRYPNIIGHVLKLAEQEACKGHAVR